MNVSASAAFPQPSDYPPALPAVDLTAVRGSLDNALYIAREIASTYTLKGGPLPALDQIESARDDAMKASELLWFSNERTGDLMGSSVEQASILALQASTSLGEIATAIANNEPQYGGPNGPSRIQIAASVAENALEGAVNGVKELAYFRA